MNDKMMTTAMRVQRKERLRFAGSVARGIS